MEPWLLFFLAISMLHIPRMNTEVVEQKTDDKNRQANQQDVFMFYMDGWQVTLQFCHRMVAQEADAQEQT